jgi:hypothetical protein
VCVCVCVHVRAYDCDVGVPWPTSALLDDDLLQQAFALACQHIGSSIHSLTSTSTFAPHMEALT